MSTPTTTRRRVQRYGIAGIGSAVLFIGIASPAAAATDVVIPLEPTEIGLLHHPTENYGGMPLDPLTGPTGTLGAVVVQYGETLTVELTDGVDPSTADVEIAFDDDADADGNPDKVYSTAAGATDPLTVTVVNGNDLEIVLPADDTVNGPTATLSIFPVETDPTVLGPEFSFFDPTVAYDLYFSITPPSAPVLAPELIAFAQVPCALTSGAPCPIGVTAGDNLVLDLTADSALRDLGLTDLTGVQLTLQDINDTDPHPVTLAVTVDGSRATAPLPDYLPAGSYGLFLGQPTLSGVSVVLAELTVAAAPAAQPVAAPTTAAPTAQALVNSGLRSNTGVTAPAEESSAGVLAGGLGLLALAGAGGVAVARTRRPAASGTGEA